MYHKIYLYSFISQVCVVMSARNIMKTAIEKNILETCVVDIISSKTLRGAGVALIKNKMFDDDFTRKLHGSSNINFYLKEYNISVKIAPNVYILHNDDKDYFESIIRSLDSDWYRQPHALYIIVLTNMQRDDVPNIFKVLLDYHIIHVLIIIEDMDDDASVYSYFPYAKGSCGRDYNNTMKLGQCKSLKDFDIVENLRNYDEPYLENCTFNVFAHEYPPLVFSKPIYDLAVGIERFLVELLLRKENISLNLTVLPETAVFGHISDNFTVTGIMENLYENEIDLLFGGFSLSYKRAMLFDFICIHLAFEDIYIPVTPSADLDDRWKIVYVMFDYKVWLLLVITMFFCSMVLSDFKDLLIFRDNSYPELLKLIGNATNNVTLSLRKKRFKNIIIIHWLWFIFIVSCYYQTRLTSYTTYRTFKQQIDEYMDLKNSNLTPCLSRGIAMFMNTSDIAPIINEEYLDIRTCTTADLALDELAKSSNKYTVTIYYQYLWWATRHLKDKNRVHIMKENLYKTHYALYFKRGFPLLKKFEVTMARIVESGFVDATKNLHRMPNDSRIASVFGAFEVSLLTLHDLIIPFCILASGHLLAFVTFILEIVHTRRGKRRNSVLQNAQEIDIDNQIDENTEIDYQINILF